MATPRFMAHRYSVPLSHPFRIAIGTVTRAENVLVVAHQGEAQGFGEGAPFPVVTGEEPAGVEARLAAWVNAGSRPAERVGLGLAGGLAVETASLDLAAREAGVPLCTLLAGAAPRPIATSITIPLLSPDEAEAAAKTRRAEGYTAFKVKAGGGVEIDLERIRRVRDVVAGAEIRVDANQGWSRDAAAALLPDLLDLGVAVLEQPLPRDDLRGHARLRGHGVPIMLDESVFGLEDARRAIDAGAADRINIKLQKTGSIEAALRLASYAASRGVPCMLGCMIESRVGILAAAHVAAAHGNIEWADLDGHTFLATDPVQGGSRIQAGAIRLDGAPGLGIDSVELGEPLVGGSARARG